MCQRRASMEEEIVETMELAEEDARGEANE
nr:MAG TPA: hypothetical protein [Caudoviricetes sp.]